MDDITQRLKAHYQECFRTHGPVPKGVDWRDAQTAATRYERMLAVIRSNSAGQVPTLLDVGCGFGGLLRHARDKNVSMQYIGIDVVPGMIEEANKLFPGERFICGDAMTDELDTPVDYVVCNGILTQKLDASIRSMDDFSRRLIVRMYSLAQIGIAFNMMTSFVNFTVENLYYKNPIETLAYCMTTLSPHVRIDHAYGMYEYTTYVYHES